MIKKNLNLFYYFEFLNLFFKIIRKYYYSHTIFPVYYTDRCTSCKKYNNLIIGNLKNSNTKLVRS